MQGARSPILSETLSGESVLHKSSAIFFKFNRNKVNSEESKGPSLGLSEEANRHLVLPERFSGALGQVLASLSLLPLTLTLSDLFLPNIGSNLSSPFSDSATVVLYVSWI